MKDEWTLMRVWPSLVKGSAVFISLDGTARGKADKVDRRIDF